jgi:hypothetical protein
MQDKKDKKSKKKEKKEKKKKEKKEKKRKRSSDSSSSSDSSDSDDEVRGRFITWMLWVHTYNKLSPHVHNKPSLCRTLETLRCHADRVACLPARRVESERSPRAKRRAGPYPRTVALCACLISTQGSTIESVMGIPAVPSGRLHAREYARDAMPTVRRALIRDIALC